MIENIRLKPTFGPPKPPQSFVEVLRMRERVRNRGNFVQEKKMAVIQQETPTILSLSSHMLPLHKRIRRCEVNNEALPKPFDLPKKRIKMMDKSIEDQSKISTVPYFLHLDQ